MADASCPSQRARDEFWKSVSLGYLALRERSRFAGEGVRIQLDTSALTRRSQLASTSPDER